MTKKTTTEESNVDFLDPIVDETKTEETKPKAPAKNTAAKTASKPEETKAITTEVEEGGKDEEPVTKPEPPKKEEVEEDIKVQGLTIAEMEAQLEHFVALRNRAHILGITTLPTDTADEISVKIADAEANLEERIEENRKLNKTLSRTEKDNIIRNHVRAEKLQLVRIRFTNMDPTKKNVGGEWYSALNEYLGNVTKFIPFNLNGRPYHVERCIYDQMKEKKFTFIPETDDTTNKEQYPTPTEAYEFAIEVLPNLTEQELLDLKSYQAAQGTIA